MAGFTASTLITSIRRRASIPSTSASGSADSDLLAIATEEIQLHLTADLLKVREEYFARDQDTTIGSSTSFRVPKRAIGGKLRYVQLLDSDGDVIATLTRLEPERLEDFDSTVSVFGFYLKGNHVHLVGETSNATSIRLGYFVRPSALTNTAAEYKAITVVAGNVVTAAAHGFSTTSVLDIVKGTPGFEHALIDTSPSATDTNTITFGSGTGLTGLGVEVGDYVCTAEKSFVPQIPAEFHPILAQRVAVKYLEAEGDRDGLQLAQAKLGEMEKAAGLLVTPRVDGAPQKIVNRYSFVGGAGRWRRFFG